MKTKLSDKALILSIVISVLTAIVSAGGINIKAAKEKVWLLIAQTGQNPGGFNSYYYGNRFNIDKICWRQ